MEIAVLQERIRGLEAQLAERGELVTELRGQVLRLTHEPAQVMPVKRRRWWGW